MACSRGLGDPGRSWFAVPISVEVLLAVLLSGLAGCCAGGSQSLSIWVARPAPVDACNWDTVAWTGQTEVLQGDSILVVPRSSDDPPTAIELYDGDRRIPLQETTREARCTHGCPSLRTWYRIDVAPGEYVLVHREKTGSGLPVHTPGGGGKDPWTTFDGDRALVTKLVVKPRSEESRR